MQVLLGDDAEITLLNQANGVAAEIGHEWVQTVCKIMESFLNTKLVAKGAIFFTDASVFTPAFGHPPTLILGPGESTMAHKIDEYCYISKIEEAVEVYTMIAQRWRG